MGHKRLNCKPKSWILPEHDFISLYGCLKMPYMTVDTELLKACKGH